MRLSLRDTELLRFLSRLGVARTSALQTLFFCDLANTRRRLRRLQKAGFIEDRGFAGEPSAEAGRSLSKYWCLGAAASARLRLRYASDLWPDVVDSETGRKKSLRFWEHQDALVNLYVEMIRLCSTDLPSLSRTQDVLQWEQERRRIGYTRTTRNEDLFCVPDVIASGLKARVFVELDRSTETTERCSKTAAIYCGYVERNQYGAEFSDGLPPRVFFVVQTPERKRSLDTAFAKAQGIARPFVEVIEARVAAATLVSLTGIKDLGHLPRKRPTAVPDLALPGAKLLLESYINIRGSDYNYEPSVRAFWQWLAENLEKNEESGRAH